MEKNRRIAGRIFRPRTEAPVAAPLPESGSRSQPLPMLLHGQPALSSSAPTRPSFSPSPTPTAPNHADRPVPSHRPPPRPLRLPTLALPGGAAVLPTISALGLLGLAALLWYADGYFTLLFLREHWPQIAAWGIGQWSIPALITIMTLWTWPRRSHIAPVRLARQQWVQTEHVHDARRYFRYRANFVRRTIFFLAVVLFNMGTSVSGLSLWGQGRTFDLFGGLTIPESGWPLWAFALIGGAVCAFAPEKIGRWTVDELRLLGDDDA